MGSTEPSAAVFPIDLGPVSAFDQRIFPLAYYDAGDNFTKGSILIKATVEEMEAIRALGIDLNNNDDFIFNTRLKMEELKDKREKLQENPKTYNPFKLFLKYRAARLFHAASKALYIKTKNTSEKIQRNLQVEERVQVIPTTRMRTISGAIPPGANVVGVAIDLPDGLTDIVERTINDARETIAITDPFGDNSIISQLREDEYAISLVDAETLPSQAEGDSGAVESNQTPVVSSDLQRSRPASPVNNIYIFNSILAANSNLNGPTVNRGSQNSGASVT